MTDLYITARLIRGYSGWKLEVERSNPSGNGARVTLRGHTILSPKEAVRIAAVLGDDVAEVVRERFREDAAEAERKLREAEERHDCELRSARESVQRESLSAAEARRVAERWPAAAEEPDRT